MEINLPELPPCPRHVDGPVGCIADCRICWNRFCLGEDYRKIKLQMEHKIRWYLDSVKKAEEVLGWRKNG